MMVSWMCGVKDIKRSGLGIWNVIVEMIGCRLVEMWSWLGKKSVDRGRKTWRECVNDDMNLLGLHPKLAVFKDTRKGFILEQTSNPS